MVGEVTDGGEAGAGGSVLSIWLLHILCAVLCHLALPPSPPPLILGPPRSPIQHSPMCTCIITHVSAGEHHSPASLLSRPSSLPPQVGRVGSSTELIVQVVEYVPQQDKRQMVLDLLQTLEKVGGSWLEVGGQLGAMRGGCMLGWRQRLGGGAAAGRLRFGRMGGSFAACLAGLAGLARRGGAGCTVVRSSL